MTENEIDMVIQKLYAWAEKRDSINRDRMGTQGFRELNQALIKDAIKCIQYLKGSGGGTGGQGQSQDRPVTTPKRL